MKAIRFRLTNICQLVVDRKIFHLNNCISICNVVCTRYAGRPKLSERVKKNIYLYDNTVDNTCDKSCWSAIRSNCRQCQQHLNAFDKTRTRLFLSVTF